MSTSYDYDDDQAQAQEPQHGDVPLYGWLSGAEAEELTGIPAQTLATMRHSHKDMVTTLHKGQAIYGEHWANSVVEKKARAAASYLERQEREARKKAKKASR